MEDIQSNLNSPRSNINFSIANDTLVQNKRKKRLYKSNYINRNI